MEKTSTWRRLGSYSVNKRLIQSLEDFVNHKVPGILYSGRSSGRDFGRAVTDFSDRSYLTLIGSYESKIYYPIGKYAEAQFHNDIQKLVIGLKYISHGGSAKANAIVLEIGAGKSIGDTELWIALQADRAEEKIKLIENGLLVVMEPFKNRNGISYPNEFLPTFIFVLGFFIGIGTLMFDQPILKSLCVVLFSIAVWLVTRRFTKGYCHFDSSRQRRMDRMQTWLSVALLVFTVTAVGIFFLR